MAVCLNHLELTIWSKREIASSIRFCVSSSKSTCVRGRRQRQRRRHPTPSVGRGGGEPSSSRGHTQHLGASAPPTLCCYPASSRPYPRPPPLPTPPPYPPPPYPCAPFSAHLIILRQGGDEDDSVDVIEGVDPFPSLVALAADVEHREVEPLDLKVGLHDAGGAHTRAKHVLLGRLKSGRGDAIEVVEVVVGRVVELILGLALEDLGRAGGGKSGRAQAMVMGAQPRVSTSF